MTTETRDALNAAFEVWSQGGTEAMAEHTGHPDGPAILPAGMPPGLPARNSALMSLPDFHCFASQSFILAQDGRVCCQLRRLDRSSVDDIGAAECVLMLYGCDKRAAPAEHVRGEDDAHAGNEIRSHDSGDDWTLVDEETPEA